MALVLASKYLLISVTMSEENFLDLSLLFDGEAGTCVDVVELLQTHGHVYTAELNIAALLNPVSTSAGINLNVTFQTPVHCGTRQVTKIF